MNKKALTRVIQFVTIFGVVLAMFMFGLIFIKEGGDQFIIQPLVNISQQISINTDVNQQTRDTLALLDTRYNQLVLPYDLIFLFFLIFGIGTAFFASFKARKLPVTSFFGMLFAGSLVILLIISFVAQFTDWFLINFFDLLFSDLGLELPIMDYFFANMSWLLYILIMICLFINRLDVSSDFTNLEEEP